MPGFTTPDGLIHEVPGDQPAISLSGGASGTFPILAEQVQALFTAQRATIADLTDRVAALETAVAASRWRDIGVISGTNTNNIVIPIPAGYKMLRLHVWGDGNDSTAQDVSLRVNGDGGSNHLWGLHLVGSDGPIPTTSYTHGGTGTNGWRIGRWATTENNSSLVHIWPVNGASNPNYVAIGARQSTGAAGHQNQVGIGKYLGDVVVSSLTLIIATTTFAQVDGTLEGYLDS